MGKKVCETVDPDGNVYVTVALPSGEIVTFMRRNRVAAERAAIERQIARDCLRVG